MRVVGFSGYSGAGKTTLLEQLIGRLVAAGQRVSVVKHAHHAFDIDVEGKDSWRHRRAGAFEVLVASDRRLALMREYEQPAEPSVHALVAELSAAGADNSARQWVLVEGFRHADIPKIEVWRAETGKAAHYPADPFIVAIATDSPAQLPVPTDLPLLDLNDVDAVSSFLLANPARYEYRLPVPTRPRDAVGADASADLLTLDEALARLIAAVRPFPAADAQAVSTFAARGRVLAADVRSAVDVPPADNTAMDGYALRCADVPAVGTVLPVSQRIAAGSVPQPLAPGSAARIFTGAQIPAGADAVVMQEDCQGIADAAGLGGISAPGGPAGSTRSATAAVTPYGLVRVDTVPQPGQSIRRRGEDVRAGAVVLPAGTRITPQAMGLAASVGAATLAVARRPRVALFSTGDELVMPGEVPADRMPPGAIYNSNRFTLRGLIESLGGECDDLGIVPDRLDATRAALREAARRSDLIVSCGGVSVGEEDHLRPAVAAEGRIDLWQIAVKPGKPLAFGEVRRPGDGDAGVSDGDGEPLDGAGAGGSAYFVGLPGNPVSSFITFLFVVRPLLLHLQGVTDWQPRGTALRADFEWPKPDRRRREFLRVRRNAQGGLDLFANQGSGVLTSVVWGDGVVDNPPAQAIRAGDAVRFIAFPELLS